MPTAVPPETTSIFLESDSPLPLDPAVEKGTLANGLTYYIRVNHEPEDRAELRLVVNAGSVLEDEDQRGLAHFVEHMAFNGTTHFPGNGVVDTLESFGMELGPGVNASTGFDSTIYRVSIPTGDPEMLDQAFLILEDWANGVSFRDKDIEDERGVVLEEWRLGRGASARLQDKTLPVLLHGSRYAERLPIGTREVLEPFSPDSLRRFYHQWYRPDLMAVVAVGDFDASDIRERIERHFGPITAPENERPRLDYAVPDHEAPLFVAAVDPEAVQTWVSIHFKRPAEIEKTVADYRKQLVRQLYSSMLNARLEELARQEDPPFLAASSSFGMLTRSEEDFTLVASVDERSIRRGMEALLVEAERARRYGFSAPELERQKRNLLTSTLLFYQERDKTNSNMLAAEYGRNFLVDEPIPGIAYEYELVNSLLPVIDLSEVDRMAEELMGERNRVVIIEAPDKGLSLPTKAETMEMLHRVATREIEPYRDEALDRPLVETVPEPAAVVSEERIDPLGITEWRLANNVRVLLKPSDFKNDEVLFTAFSPGGHSLVADSDYVAAVTAATLVSRSGAGEFTQSELQKKLAGRAIAVAPDIDELTESLSGRSSVNDLEVMFQLIYLYMTAPRIDEQTFASFKNRMKADLENRLTDPETVFSDAVNRIMTQDNFRRRPLTPESLEEMDRDRSLAIYRDRFGDASDFTFIFVGSFTLEEIRPLVQRYIGSLPARGRMETWRDIGVQIPTGRIEKEVRKGLEPKSIAAMIFSGPFDWKLENRFRIQAMADLLRRRLRDRLREEMGSIYSVDVSAGASHYPRQEYRVSITFGGAPDRMDKIIRAALAEIETSRLTPPPSEEVEKIKEGIRRERELDLRSNTYWLYVLQFYSFHHESFMQILEFDRLIDALNPKGLQEAVNTYLNPDNYVQVVLYPEKKNGE